MWAGTKVHDCIKNTLTNLQRGILIFDVDDIVAITLDQMRDEFRSSREKQYFVNPKICALFEHENKVDLLDIQWKKVAENVELCLRNFYRSEIFDTLKNLPQKDWL